MENVRITFTAQAGKARLENSGVPAVWVEYDGARLALRL